jgi:predicted nuclease of predicted toxin-antitoxin system
MEDAGLPLLLDQGLPRDAAQQLRASGVPCTHVGELGMSAAADIEILESARLRGSAVVTLDADFHAILAVQGATKPSVIRLRLQGLNGAAVAGLLHQNLAQYRKELEAGCMITVKPRKTTCHLLSRAD